MGQIDCQDSRICNIMTSNYSFTLLFIIVIIVSNVTNVSGQDQLLSVVKVRNLKDKTNGKIFKLKGTKVFTSMAVLKKMQGMWSKLGKLMKQKKHQRRRKQERILRWKKLKKDRQMHNLRLL